VDSGLNSSADVVWPETKQIGLIDSLFRNYYVPPIIFAVRTDEDGEEIRLCVDGKQVSSLWWRNMRILINNVRLAAYINTNVLRRTGESLLIRV
jgi:hypothetical protein